MADIHLRLAEAIKNSGKKQKDIAVEIGVNPATISKFSLGTAFPALDTFAKLCIALDITSDEILGINNNK